MGLRENRLCFSSDGSYLLQSGYKSVRLWQAERLLAECPGRLMGMARDGQTFLTYDGPRATFAAWRSAAGTALELAQVDPAQYAANQRYYITRKGLTLTFHDALGREAAQDFTFPGSDYASCDNWALSPDGHLLAIAFFAEAGGHDAAFGQCFARHKAGHFERIFEFEVDRFVSTPVVAFCEPYALLAVSTPNSLSLFLTNGKLIREFDYELSGGKFIAIHPTKKEIGLLQYAHHTWRLFAGSRREDVQEAQSILDAAFHPDGKRVALLLNDQSIRFYDIETLALLAELRGPET